jgi:hypothetical protein
MYRTWEDIEMVTSQKVATQQEFVKNHEVWTPIIHAKYLNRLWAKKVVIFSRNQDT